MTREEINVKEREIAKLIEGFCSECLNDEYLQLCKKLLRKMGRKKDVPFKRGKNEIWAASIIHVIGSINFLFDKSFEPYIDMGRISEYFGANKSTVTNKSRQIKDMLDIYYYHPELSTQHMLSTNPLNDMVMVDGFIVPLTTLPEEYQEMVRQARAEGKDIEFTTE